MSPEAAVPSAMAYRGSLLTLAVVSALAVFLIIRPPSDDSAADEPRAVVTPPPTQTVQPTEEGGSGDSTPGAQSTQAAGASPTADPSGTAASGRTHTVVDGDTLFAIAEQYDVTADEIQAANPGVSFDPLGLGTVLVIPGGE